MSKASFLQKVGLAWICAAHSAGPPVILTKATLCFHGTLEHLSKDEGQENTVTMLSRQAGRPGGSPSASTK